MISDFKGKTAVLTGGASGFGLECARIGASLGMNLVIVDVQADALKQAHDELKSTGATVMAKKAHPGKDRKNGFFGFAGHNDAAEFRNIEIKDLSAK